jgi:hypothetical protein
MARRSLAPSCWRTSTKEEGLALPRLVTGTPVRVMTLGEPLLSWRMTRLLELLMPGPEMVAWKTAVEVERV